MKFETRRERETRRKRQKQSAILGMVLAFALVMIMGSRTGLMRLMNIKSISRPKNLQKKLQRTNSA